MEKVLLPTDFSDNAWSATVYAMKLYAKTECNFYFLHATKMKVSTMSNMTNKLLHILEDNAKKELFALKNKSQTSNINPNHNFETILSSSLLQEAIAASVRTFDIDVIIMNTKGTTSAKDIFFGSNTINTINSQKSCPILLVPYAFDFVLPSQIAFPTDFKHPYEEKVLDPLKKIANLWNSSIRIVHINEDEHLDDLQSINLTLLTNHLKNYEHSFHWMPNYDKKSIEIHDFIEALDINLLVLIHYNHSFFERIIKEPVIKKIAFYSTIPFLVIPE